MSLNIKSIGLHPVVTSIWPMPIFLFILISFCVMHSISILILMVWMRCLLHLEKTHRLLFLLMILMFINPGSHNAIPGNKAIHIQISVKRHASSAGLLTLWIVPVIESILLSVHYYFLFVPYTVSRRVWNILFLHLTYSWITMWSPVVAFHIRLL